jgi:acyl-CoA reductase-like NAD-dependent aldehyde dehydrogenase
MALHEILLRARAAQGAWAAKTVAERLAPVARLRGRLAADPGALADVVAREVGKTRYEALGAEVLPVAETCGFLAARARRLLAPRREKLRGTMPFSGAALVRHVPWGVVAVLVPWNYPLFLGATPVLHALVAGNAVVIKPSPRARETMAAFAEWLYAAGVPRELAPVLDSSDETGRALTAALLVNKIVFTGSSRTGRSVLASAAQNLVPATVELSGCDAVFVLRDANLKLAAAAVAFGLRINAGRSCVCPHRVFVEEPVAAPFTALLSARLASSNLLAPMDAQTLREADELSAKLTALPNVKLLNGRAPGDREKALVVGGGAEALAAVQGCFVPAVVVTPVQDMAEALRLDAASPYALGASIFTRDMATAQALAGQLRAGLVAINECVAPAGEAALPFGGGGESGYGVRAGDEGLLEMTRPQVLAFARGTFRPHHVAGSEAESFLRALLRARHGAGLGARLKGWLDYTVESIKWRPPKTH